MVALIVFSTVFFSSFLGSSAAEMNTNLTSITWAHAVNNQAFLESVLKEFW
ncbi:hypothetical protein Bhyg_15986 [Pseudolycoriella hygida]|uniref:Uncharacterized protein n=1 Tax=Pseudolycoriella hygida TaxID=35572 RepID=A0A9Q0MNA1_9DIPT|nr:hypothetical protein Bhyg_15986 [Pseudolycoriella hygida]